MDLGMFGKRDAQLDGPPGDGEGCLAGGARFGRQLHGSEPEPPYTQIPADAKRGQGSIAEIAVSRSLIVDEGLS